MEPVSKEEFLLKLGQARKCRTGLESLCLHDADISGADFSGLDCQWWDMRNVRLDGCDFEGATIANGKFENCTFVGANFRNAGLQGQTSATPTLPALTFGEATYTAHGLRGPGWTA